MFVLYILTARPRRPDSVGYEFLRVIKELFLQASTAAHTVASRSRFACVHHCARPTTPLHAEILSFSSSSSASGRRSSHRSFGYVMHTCSPARTHASSTRCGRICSASPADALGAFECIPLRVFVPAHMHEHSGLDIEQDRMTSATLESHVAQGRINSGREMSKLSSVTQAEQWAQQHRQTLQALLDDPSHDHDVGALLPSDQVIVAPSSMTPSKSGNAAPRLAA